MLTIIILCSLSQYQVASNSQTALPKQNGNTPGIKSTTIHISSGTPSGMVTPTTNSNSNNSNKMEAVWNPVSVIHVPIDVPASMHAPTDSDTHTSGTECESTQIQREEDLERKMYDLTSTVSADTQNKPSSDTLQ